MILNEHDQRMKFIMPNLVSEFFLKAENYEFTKVGG